MSNQAESSLVDLVDTDAVRCADGAAEPAGFFARSQVLHFYTATVGSVFFEMVERRGSYDGYGAPNAPVRHAVQYDHLHQLKLTA